MSEKFYIPADENAPVSQIGACLDALSATIARRKEMGQTAGADSQLAEGLSPSTAQGVVPGAELPPAERAIFPNESYTYRLLSEPVDKLLKKVMEEAGEVALAAKDVEALLSSADDEGRASGAQLSTSSKDACASAPVETHTEGLDAALDHLRYESADVVYHLFVLLGRYGISADELAAELNSRMKPDERPCGGALMRPEHIKRS